MGKLYSAFQIEANNIQKVIQISCCSTFSEKIQDQVKVLKTDKQLAYMAVSIQSWPSSFQLHQLQSVSPNHQLLTPPFSLSIGLQKWLSHKNVIMLSHKNVIMLSFYVIT